MSENTELSKKLEPYEKKIFEIVLIKDLNIDTNLKYLILDSLAIIDYAIEKDYCRVLLHLKTLRKNIEKLMEKDEFEEEECE